MPFKQLPYLRPDHYIFSAQKSGRTWLRMILAKALQELGYNPQKLEMVPSFHSSFEQVVKKHDPKQMNVVFLYRDPRDCVVSRYFEITRRRIRPKSENPTKVYNSTLSNYIRRDDEYGIRAIVLYMNSWYQGRNQFKSFLPIGYEELKLRTMPLIMSLLDFIKVAVSNEVVQRAVEYAQFENMSKIERTGKGNLIQKYHGTFGERHQTNDPESFRVRKGKVGGFVDYLSPEDIQYVNQCTQELDGFFQYGRTS